MICAYRCRAYAVKRIKGFLTHPGDVIMRNQCLFASVVISIFCIFSASAWAETMPSETLTPAVVTAPPSPLGVSPGEVVLIAPTSTDKESLAGLKEVKMVFDISVGDPKKFLDCLELIEQTRVGLLKQGVTPRFVLAFRGPASRLTQKDPGLVKASDQVIVAKIHEKLLAMSKDKNVELDQCAMGNTLQRVKNEDTYPELKLVSNSLITIAAYQNKGYGYLPFE
jgi:intracellular sulfur oxidation DsrE/DsrF family protein